MDRGQRRQKYLIRKVSGSSMAKAWRCQRGGSMFSHLFYLNRVLLSGAHTDDVTGRHLHTWGGNRTCFIWITPSAFAFPSKALLTSRPWNSVVACSWGSLLPPIKELCLSLYWSPYSKILLSKTHSLWAVNFILQINKTRKDSNTTQLGVILMASEFLETQPLELCIAKLRKAPLLSDTPIPWNHSHFSLVSTANHVLRVKGFLHSFFLLHSQEVTAVIIACIFHTLSTARFLVWVVCLYV